MNVKSFGLAVVAGIATFLLVGVAVTEFTQPWIEFSLLLGLPIGLAAGVFATAAVYLGFAEDAPQQRRRTATAVAGFGAGFVLAIIVLGGLLSLGGVLSLLIALLVGVAVGLTTYLRAGESTT